MSVELTFASFSIRRVLSQHAGLYYPTYFAILSARNDPNFLGDKKSLTPRLPPYYFDGCEEFAAERRAVLARLAKGESPVNSRPPSRAAKPSNQPSKEAVSVQCGCCFGDCEVQETVVCLEGHRFCKECVKQHAEGALGGRKLAITCMDASSKHFPSNLLWSGL